MDEEFNKFFVNVEESISNTINSIPLDPDDFIPSDNWTLQT